MCSLLLCIRLPQNLVTEENERALAHSSCDSGIGGGLTMCLCPTVSHKAAVMILVTAAGSSERNVTCELIHTQCGCLRSEATGVPAEAQAADRPFLGFLVLFEGMGDVHPRC